MPIDKERLKECYSYSTDDFTSKHILAPLGNLWSHILVRTPFTPNQITAFWGLLMIACSITFVFGNYVLSIVVGVLWVIAYSLDYTDGTIARYKNKTSRKGPFIDMINHRTSYMLLMFCIGICAWRFGRTEFFGYSFAPELYILLGFAAGFSMVLIMDFGEIYSDVAPELDINDGDGCMNVEGRKFKNKNLFAFISNINPLTFTNMMCLVPIFAAVKLLDVFIIIYGILYPLAALNRYFVFLGIIKEVEEKYDHKS